MKKLVLSTPSSELVDAYLFEIAKGYGVNWSSPTPLAKEGGSDGEPKDAEKDVKVYLDAPRILSRSNCANITNHRSKKRKRGRCWIM